MAFGIPMIWKEPKDVTIFVKLTLKVLIQKNKSKIEYPNLSSLIQLITNSDKTLQSS